MSKAVSLLVALLPLASRGGRRALRSRRSAGCSRPIPITWSASTGRRSYGATARACRSTTAEARRRSKSGSTIPISRTRSRSLIRPETERALRQRTSIPDARAMRAFFDKLYGDCRKGEVEKNLATIVWLPSKGAQRLRVTKVNGVAQRLEAVSRELDQLPARFDVFLTPSAGTYNCRTIAGTPASPRTATASPSTSRRRGLTTGAMRARQGRRLRLSQRDPARDRAHLREARLHLGREVVPLRHHALRVPAGARWAAN